MISMTGYGRATCQVFGRRLVIEIRSLNHRFFDLKLRLPWSDAPVEALVTQAVRRRIERGALALTVREDAGGPAPEVRVDVALAKSYHHALRELARELGMPDADIPIEVLIAQRDVIAVGSSERSGDELYEALRPGLDGALDALVRHGVALFGSPPREPWGRLMQIVPSGGHRDVRHLVTDEIVLGREEGDIVFRDDAFMSRRHAAITWNGTRAQLTDLGSSNGTFVRITTPTLLKHGDHVCMGDQLLRIELSR